jgi:hypothetical protein
MATLGRGCFGYIRVSRRVTKAQTDQASSSLGLCCNENCGLMYCGQFANELTIRCRDAWECSLQVNLTNDAPTPRTTSLEGSSVRALPYTPWPDVRSFSCDLTPVQSSVRSPSFRCPLCDSTLSDLPIEDHTAGEQWWPILPSTRRTSSRDMTNRPTDWLYLGAPVICEMPPSRLYNLLTRSHARAARCTSACVHRIDRLRK